MDKSGNLYVADSGNNRVRKVSSSGTISTIAGGITSGFSGDGMRAVFSRLSAPRGIAVDSAGDIYVADTGNNRIREIAADGTINTIAGNGTAAFGGDGGPAVSASFKSPYGVALDSAGLIYIAEYSSSRIRRIALSGGISTIAGNGRFGFTGDGGAATNAAFNFPSGVAVAASGNIYVADVQNNAVRLLSPVPGSSPALPSIDKGGVVSVAAFGASSAAAPGSWIEIYGANFAGTSRSWTGGDFKGLSAPTWLDGTTVTIGGQAAAIDYISPGQVNVQVPSQVAAGEQNLVVTNNAGASEPYPLTIHDTEPGLYSPPQFNIAGRAYAGALFTDYSFVLLPGASPATVTRRARPGDTILLFGVGFGPVLPDTPSGQLVQGSNSVATPLQFFFGDVQATTSYAGLAPNQVGLYQFNVLVPGIPASDAVPLTFTLGGKKSTQALYIAIE